MQIVLLLAAVTAALAAASPPPEDAACAAARDRRLAALALEQNSIKTQLDTDAAAIDAPEYSLRKVERAIDAEFAAERAAVAAAYRACLKKAAKDIRRMAPR